jgi:hypothetical protein
MSPSPNDPRPPLSAENSGRLDQALRLSQELQTPTPDAQTTLVELRILLDQCREGIREQNPDHAGYRLKAVDKARNYLHFLPALDHPEAEGRLRGVGRRLRRAMRSA